MFSAIVFNSLCQFIACRSDMEFLDMYYAVGLQSAAAPTTYTMEKFNLARSNFIAWWTNIDRTHQEKILKYIQDFYDLD